MFVNLVYINRKNSRAKFDLGRCLSPTGTLYEFFAMFTNIILHFMGFIVMPNAVIATIRFKAYESKELQKMLHVK